MCHVKKKIFYYGKLNEIFLITLIGTKSNAWLINRTYCTSDAVNKKFTYLCNIN